MPPLDWQKDVMREIARGTRRLSVKSGHGCGKSSCASAIILWFLLVKYPAKVVVTAPTAAQLLDALFAEVKRRHRQMPPAIRDLLEATSDRIYLKSNPAAVFCSLKVASKERPESLAGVHVEEPGGVLLIADEASGVDEVVFESGSGSMSGKNATTLLLGNPLRNSGFFYRTHTDLANDWWTKTVSCADNPLVSDDFLRDMAQRYGENSAQYHARVLGEFPPSDEDTYIPLNLITAAVTRDIERVPTAGVVWGVDVGRQGPDASALAKRAGNVLLEPVKTWKQKDTMELCGIILNEYETTPIMERPETICIDVIGIGAGVVDRCLELGLPARGINVAESAALSGTYMRQRDELWGRAKEWFEQKECKIPDDQALIHELGLPRFSFTSTGKIKIESKDELKKRGHPSPNVADAFIMTFSEQAIGASHGTRYNWKTAVNVDTSWIV